MLSPVLVAKDLRQKLSCVTRIENRAYRETPLMLTYNEKKYDERCGENRQNIELIRGRITYETLKKITSMNER